jgi:hypothetical protein
MGGKGRRERAGEGMFGPKTTRPAVAKGRVGA